MTIYQKCEGRYVETEVDGELVLMNMATAGSSRWRTAALPSGAPSTESGTWPPSPTRSPAGSASMLRPLPATAANSSPHWSRRALSSRGTRAGQRRDPHPAAHAGGDGLPGAGAAADPLRSPGAMEPMVGRIGVRRQRGERGSCRPARRSEPAGGAPGLRCGGTAGELAIAPFAVPAASDRTAMDVVAPPHRIDHNRRIPAGCATHEPRRAACLGRIR